MHVDPTGRRGEVSVPVGAAVFLADTASSGNGHTLHIDGRITTRR